MLAVRWEPDNLIGADLAALAARELLLDGNAVFHARPAPGGGFDPRPASGYEVSGGEPWTYDLRIAGPDSVRSLRRRAPGVFHFRINSDARTPWEGRAPLERAADSARALCAIEAGLRDEANIPSMRLLALPPASGMSGLRPGVTLNEALKDGRARGSVMVLHSARSGESGPPTRTESEPGQMKPSPDPNLLKWRRQLTAECVEALGVPCGLIVPDGQLNGPSVVQLHRRFLSTGITPLCEVIKTELERKAGVEVKFDLSELRLADLAAMSRAVHGLGAAGVDVERALELVGWSDDD